MEDLWRLDALGFRLPDLAGHAEYHRMLERFHAEEVQKNTQQLLFQRQPFHPPDGKDPAAT